MRAKSAVRDEELGSACESGREQNYASHGVECLFNAALEGDRPRAHSGLLDGLYELSARRALPLVRSGMCSQTHLAGSQCEPATRSPSPSTMSEAGA